MPVPQTLAKKLNKDVFQGGEREREREATCILSGVGHTSQTLSRPEKRQGQASVKKKNPPSSLTNPNQRLQLLLWGREQGGAGRGGDELQREKKWI